MRFPCVLLALALTASACDTVGEVPTLDDLERRYGGLAEGAFRLYDADLDSTLTGTAEGFEFGPARLWR